MADILEIASKPAGDGMPIGNYLTPRIASDQVKVGRDGIEEPEFDDNAAATIVWMDFQRDSAWLEQEAWLEGWQYIQYWYQSPNYDAGWRTAGNKAARISRFNIAKNTNTMATQIRRGIFAGQSPFMLEAQGKMAADPEAQTYLDGWTELLAVLDQRADFEYEFGRLIHCQCLQGTGIGVPRWTQKKVMRYGRKPRVAPDKIEMPVGGPTTVHTWESDDWEPTEDEVTESWPAFEYRRLGTTIWDEKCCTPNRPDKSAMHRIDIDYVNLQDLQQMREQDDYYDIPSDDELKKFFLDNPYGDGEASTLTARNMSMEATALTGASGEWKNASQNPFEHPIMKLSYWTKERAIEMLCYQGRKKVIRNSVHALDDHALGYSANWWDIDSCLYGIGIGRLNVGDQRMDQGVLNEILKMIAWWTNTPLVYNTADGNAPTQNNVFGLGTMWGLNGQPGGDVSKLVRYLEKPTIPKEAFQIYELAKEGGEDLVGANSSSMQGNITSTQGMSRTATGAARAATQSDAQVADPIANLEGVIVRWNRFKQRMVQNVMPIAEIRQILSKKFGDAIVESIDPKKFLDMEFNIKVLAGQKLAAKAAIAQLIPFLLQLLQQPQLMEYMHQKGWTINFLAIEKIFLRVSELQGAEDIIVQLTDEEKQQVQQLNPAIQRAKAAASIEQLKGQNEIAKEQERGKQQQQLTILKPMAERAAAEVPLENEFSLAEERVDRATDQQELTQGIEQP